MVTANDFDNAEVRNAQNPSAFGYHYGPIFNPNVAWTPPSVATARAAGCRPGNVTAAENATAPNPGQRLSHINTGVCDICVNGAQMCGCTFVAAGQQPSLRRHIRNEHFGAVANTSRQNVTLQETIAGQNAIKRFVLIGGWRDQRYVFEPGVGPAGGYCDLYATQLENIAASDPQFAAQWGTRFHRSRQPAVATPDSARKRKRGRTPPSQPRSPSPTTRPAAKEQKKRGRQKKQKKQKPAAAGKSNERRRSSRIIPNPAPPSAV